MAVFVCSFAACMTAYGIAMWHERDIWKEIKDAKKRLDALEKK
jgi:hypothetical protein